MRYRSPLRRPGRHRASVLVGIGIGVLVAGLLIPAVQKTRELSDRTRCQNNARWIELGLQNYECAQARFPPGTMPNPDLPPERRLSWMFQLIPYMECTDMYSRADLAAAWDADHNRPVTTYPYRPYICPQVFDGSTFHTTYLGVAGVGPDAATLPPKDPRSGVFGYDRQTRFIEMTDGPETTLLFCETTAGGPWAQGGPGTVRGFDPTDRPHLGPGRPFGSRHVAERPWVERTRVGANVGLADGSVRFVSKAVAPEVLEALATVAGKEELPAAW